MQVCISLSLLSRLDVTAVPYPRRDRECLRVHAMHDRSILGSSLRVCFFSPTPYDLTPGLTIHLHPEVNGDEGQ